MDYPTHYLNIGEMIVSCDEIMVSTVLGSCVSVCLFSESQTAGGIIHYSLPKVAQPIEESDSLKYGELAIPLLIEEVMRLGGLNQKNHQLKAKVVGGASELRGRPAPYPVGSENIEIAHQILATYHIPIVGERVGGAVGQKVHFFIPSGRLQVAKVG